MSRAIDDSAATLYLDRHVQAELEQLLILQDRQQKIRQIENEIKNLPMQRKHLETQLADSAASLEAIKHKASRWKSIVRSLSSMSARATTALPVLGPSNIR